LTLSITACGTIATPVPNMETLEAQNHQEIVSEPTGEVEVVAVIPTNTPVPPTATSIPPTEIPTEAPTEVVVEATEVVTEAPAVDLSTEDQQVLIFIQEFGNP
ncbi:MAG TPA: hypothetical protein PLZ51_18420, partial [Aggregatilineales bacterium]|nr:hypothetical protein [Aggregatilineales bacterium]